MSYVSQYQSLSCVIRVRVSERRNENGGHFLPRLLWRLGIRSSHFSFVRCLRTAQGRSLLMDAIVSVSRRVCKRIQFGSDILSTITIRLGKDITTSRINHAAPRAVVNPR